MRARHFNGHMYVPATYKPGVKVGSRLLHYKHAQCPVPGCTTQFEARSDDVTWNDAQWKEGFLKAGWKCLRGAYGREVFVCSDACAQKALHNW